MVHPHVLAGCGIDPEEYGSGFAFGIGLDRLTTTTLKISDIRLLFENDLRFSRAVPLSRKPKGEDFQYENFLSWLKHYVDIDVPLDELCDKMIMRAVLRSGMWEDLSATMEQCVVGRIVKLEKHPDADKLHCLPDRCGRCGARTDCHRRNQCF